MVYAGAANTMTIGFILPSSPPPAPPAPPPVDTTPPVAPPAPPAPAPESVASRNRAGAPPVTGGAHAGAAAGGRNGAAPTFAENAPAAAESVGDDRCSRRGGVADRRARGSERQRDGVLRRPADGRAHGRRVGVSRRAVR